MKTISGIYIFTFPNGKQYVGQSIHLKRRMSEHFNKDSKKVLPICVVDRAINKYRGKTQTIKMEYPIEELDEWENYYIDLFNTFTPNGYNRRRKGNLAKESREQISKTLMGHVESEETKKKKSLARMGEKNPFFGKKHPIEKHPRSKRYIFISPNGLSYKVFGDFNGFCRSVDLIPNSMRNVLMKTVKSYRGWRVEYDAGYNKQSLNEIYH